MAKQASVELKAGAGAGLRIGIVVARFNAQITSAMLAHCKRALASLGVKDDDITVAAVPGALEAPLALQKMACTQRYDALVALGAVIRGETYHFELVANESAAGITAVQLDRGIPIANGILTTENEAQALARVEEKGVACAAVAVEMAVLLKTLERS